MSADCWRICPLCEKKRKEQIIEHKKNVEEGYGILSKDEYLEAIRCSENEEEVAETLREDHEICTDNNGLFFVNYTCYCTECKFTYSFSCEEEVMKKYNKEEEDGN